MGMTRNELSASVARLAGRPQRVTRLKCWIANGPVASPATKLTSRPATNQSFSRWARRIGQGAAISREAWGQTSTMASRAAVAANDIWKPGWVTASGWKASTTRAAMARLCRVSARRSSRTAIEATAAVMAERWAGGGQPAITR